MYAPLRGRINRSVTTLADRRLARQLGALVRPHLRRLAVAALCQLVSTLAFLALPFIIRILTDSVFIHHDAARLNQIALLLFATVVVSALFTFLRGYLLSSIGGRIVADLRTRLYEHLQSLSISFYDSHRVGDLMSRLTSDTTLMQTVVTENLLSFGQHVITLVGVIVVILLLDWRLALVTIVLAPLMTYLGMLVGRKTRRLSEQTQARNGQANIVLQETLSAPRVVKAFGRERHETARYAEQVESAFQIGLATARLRSAFEAIVLALSSISIAAVLWFGGHEVLAGRLSAGGLISFLFYLIILTGPVQTLASLYGGLQHAAGGAIRVFELLNVQPAIVDAAAAYPLPLVKGRIEVRDLWFSYSPDLTDVLRGIGLILEPGQTVAVVGPSGAGKTTLMSLLLRFYDPTRGSILVDGHDIRNVTVGSLRSAYAFVPQETILFGGTVRENIAYGRIDADDAAVEHAARLANAHVFIDALPKGYDSPVGERGVQLSGGQRQRIAIARALLKDAPLLILDEATSALDNESEALVQDALGRLMAGRTTFVIAHRLTTVERADSIVVLDKGRVIEQGRHAELLARHGLYHRLYMRAFETATNISDHDATLPE
jgi:ATP-binding cassette, subfamily B, bacterial MsbA